jgi:hypothetical protein
MTNRNEREPIAMNKKGVKLESWVVRRFAAVAGLMLFFVGAAHAQQASATTPQFEASGAYSYIRANAANSNGGFNLNGGSGSLAYNVSDSFAVVGDFGGYRFSGLPSGLSSTMYTYLLGPQYSFHKVSHFTPFAHVLLGAGRLNASAGGLNAGENGFAMAIGGGIDVPLRRRFAIRIIQAEYLLTRFDSVNGASATQNDARISAGLVLRFGSK